MKRTLFLIPLMGVALIAAAGEPAATDAPSNDATLSVAKNTSADMKGGNLSATDDAFVAKLGQQLARSGELTIKPSQAKSAGLLQSLNPFAPVQSVPETPWLSRAAWTTAAEKAAPAFTPVEIRHESHLGVVIATR